MASSKNTLAGEPPCRLLSQTQARLETSVTANTAAVSLPLSETALPTEQSEVQALVADAYAARKPVYPIGGGLALDFGLPARNEGLGLMMSGLSRVIDYPARDLTITVEAGITLKTLQRTLAEEGQWLPLEAYQPEAATLGGVLAVNFSGPRRYGYGTARDYVIGITAVDGRGESYRGGGRVVKNVAGYDFCKLLVGSLGTVGIITQVTLKLRPRPEDCAMLVCEPADWDQAERLLDALVCARVVPVSIDLATGPALAEAAEFELSGRESALLAVGFEGSQEEVAWQVDELSAVWQSAGVHSFRTLAPAAAQQAWERLTGFGCHAQAALVLKLNIRPSRVTSMMSMLCGLEGGCSIVARAGSGIVLVKFERFKPADISKLLIGKIRPAAIAAGGGCVVWSAASGMELTHQAVFGPDPGDRGLMRAVKSQFDPAGILNPGRFVYGVA